MYYAWRTSCVFAVSVSVQQPQDTLLQHEWVKYFSVVDLVHARAAAKLLASELCLLAFCFVCSLTLKIYIRVLNLFDSCLWLIYFGMSTPMVAASRLVLIN